MVIPVRDVKSYSVGYARREMRSTSRGLGQNNCLNVVCANGGVCNPFPTFENGVEIQCTCPIGKSVALRTNDTMLTCLYPSGYGGSNCELTGKTRASSTLETVNPCGDR